MPVMFLRSSKSTWVTVVILELINTKKMYLWQSLCTLYLLKCQVRITVGDSGLYCCTYVTYFEC